jgi:hypothetical protein
MVMKTAESQNVKIYKVCAAVRLNRYAIDSQNQYSRRENFRISGIEEADDENVCSSDVGSSPSILMSEWLKLFFTGLSSLS